MDRIHRLKLRLADENISDELAQELLDCACDVILGHKYQYGGWPVQEVYKDGVPTGQYAPYLDVRYHGKQIDIAVELYGHMGAEGQLAHRENGIDRTWASAYVSQDMLASIKPVAGIVRRGK